MVQYGTVTCTLSKSVWVDFLPPFRQGGKNTVQSIPARTAKQAATRNITHQNILAVPLTRNWELTNSCAHAPENIPPFVRLNTSNPSGVLLLFNVLCSPPQKKRTRFGIGNVKDKKRTSQRKR